MRQDLQRIINLPLVNFVTHWGSERERERGREREWEREGVRERGSEREREWEREEVREREREIGKGLELILVSIGGECMWERYLYVI